MRSVAGEVFERGEHLVFREGQARSLISPHGGDAEPRDQIGILAVGFFDTSPSGIAPEIDDRREHGWHRGREPLCGDAHQPFDQRRVPRAREADRHGEMCASRRREAVQRLFVEHHGNAEPRVLDHPLLDGVDELGVLAWLTYRPPRGGSGDFARPGDLSDAVADERLGLPWHESPRLVLDFDFLAPDAEELRDLFLEGHPREQVGHARVDRNGRVAVTRTCPERSRRVAGRERRQGRWQSRRRARRRH